MLHRSAPAILINMKKIIILQTSGNELANQLWNYASVFAYTKEKGYDLENPAFFEYGNFFTMRAAHGWFKTFFFTPFTDYTKRKTALRRRIWRKLFFWYARLVFKREKANLIAYNNTKNEPYYLPPTKEPSERLAELETQNGNIFLNSWLFRNPVGLRKYRREIQAYFRPRKDIEDIVVAQIEKRRKTHGIVIGIHIRQGDYLTWKNGAFFVDQSRAREIIDEYLSFIKKDKEDAFFIITSDGPIDQKIFEGLSYVISRNNAVTDLFLLSSTDAVIGSNSTFGAFAAYYGNTPFIVMQNTPMDWEYYGGKEEFFENKYSTVVHY